MAVRIDRDVNAFGGAHALRLSNPDVELIVSTDYGPRILRYAFRGDGTAGDNVFGFVDPKEQAQPTPFGEPWHVYGGHRVWHAPEDPLRTYVPDNAPVAVALDGGAVVLTQRPEEPTGLAKELRVSLSDTGSRVVVTHRITNVGARDVELAVWGLSVMAPGGRALLPNPPFRPHPEALLPSRRLVTWPYTWLGDPRFRWGPRFTRVSHDPTSAAPQKIGVADVDVGWAAYAVGDRLFVKRYAVASAETRLVDLGCNVEVFTGAAFLELETLGPLVTLKPGGTARHDETWQLFGGVVVSEDDGDAETTIAKLFAA